MAQHIDTGIQGEKIAQKYLSDHGFSILATNWRFGKNEIDIIAEKDDFLVIVEVKTRSSDRYGEPELFVTRQKQRFLIRAANAYINWKSVNKETRFDIISVLIGPEENKVKHIEDAFYPTLIRERVRGKG